MPKKNKLTALRWPEYEYEKIVKRAERKAMSVSEYIRYMVDRGERCVCLSESPGGNTEAGDW